MNRFLLLFIAIPLIEMVLLIKVGQQIGALSTVGLVILTAVIGIALLKRQGLAMLNRANWKINRGQLPAREMAEGIVLAVGGALLLTPGFLTDAIGFICILPGSRHFLLNQALKNIRINPTQRSDHESQWHRNDQHSGYDSNNASKQKTAGDIIDGEYERKK